MHCRAGIGRSSLIAACIIASHDLDIDEAFRRIAATRGVAVPDTEDQAAWARIFATT